MHKKLITVSAAIAAFAAFVVAPVASASPVLTENGVAVPVGTQISGKSTGEVKLTGSSPVICTSASVGLQVTENSGTQIKGEIPGGELVVAGTGTSGDCTSALGPVNMLWNRICLAAFKGTDSVELSGCGSSATFTMGLTGTGTCKYSASGWSGALKTNSATIRFPEEEMKLEEGGIFCPSSQKLDLDLDLTTTEGVSTTFS